MAGSTNKISMCLKGTESTNRNLMRVHWARQEERSIMWSVKLVTKNIDGRNTLDVILCTEVGSQKSSKLHQRVMALQKHTLSTKNLCFLFLSRCEIHYQTNSEGYIPGHRGVQQV